jgi:2-polyprenyl-6-methoxyphenol hydroxylase-like FAD-dependent oxidoreductase
MWETPSYNNLVMSDGNGSPVLPVLIVGAGPVGLALAGELAWRGVRSIIVERTDGSIEQPRMDYVGNRTMEFCRRWGIVDLVEHGPYPRDYPQDNVYLTSMTGWELGRQPFPSMRDAKPPAVSPQKPERCPQDMFDPILRAWVGRSPLVELRYNTEMISFAEDRDVVIVDLRNVLTGATERLRAPYLVGCDGSASRVRQLLGIEMFGTPVLTDTTNIIFRCEHLNALHDRNRAYRHIFIGPEGTWATIVAINGRDRWRMSIVRSKPEGLTPDEVAAAIRRAVGVDFDFEILSIMHWKRRELVAERFASQRVLIAGDSAHVMSPTGGFGMNTGIADAVDAGWKIAARLEGWGDPALIDAYTAERRPIAERNVKESSGNLARMLSPGNNPELCDDTEEGARVRERVGREFSEAMKREWFTQGIHLGYRYDESPICWPDGTPTPTLDVMTYEQSARPGSRAPHVWLRDGRSTLDLFGHGFTLLVFDDINVSTLEHAAATSNVPLTVQRLREPEARTAYERALCLVRPDGMVAWRGDSLPEDASLLIDCVRGVRPYAWLAREGVPS